MTIKFKVERGTQRDFRGEPSGKRKLLGFRGQINLIEILRPRSDGWARAVLQTDCTEGEDDLSVLLGFSARSCSIPGNKGGPRKRSKPPSSQSRLEGRRKKEERNTGWMTCFEMRYEGGRVRWNAEGVRGERKHGTPHHTSSIRRHRISHQ